MWLRLWKLMKTKSLTVYALCTFSHQPTLTSLHSGSLSWLRDPSLTSGLCLWLMLSARLGVAHSARTQRKSFWPLETVVDLCSWSLLIYCGNYCQKNYYHQRKSLAFMGLWVQPASYPDLHSVEAVIWWDLPASHCPSQSSLHVSIVDKGWDISAQCGIVLKSYSIPCTPHRPGRCGANVRVWHFPLDKPLLAADPKNGAQLTL